ncbi:MAG: hypothetical protein LBS56_10750, partial [Propionibacteriaceae bacterium]|nr:hypothetical protein [Propionibacteriaceae bacterium]
MTRFIGPLAGLWPDLTAERLRPLLLPPERALPGADLTGADGPTVTTLVERAEADLGTPWPPVPAHAWARFRHDGDRQEYESQLFARTTRLSRAVVAAACSVGPGGVVSGVPGGDEGASPGRPAPDLVPGADDWLAEVADGVILLCEQSSWCWPAHDDAHERSGFVLPDVTRPFLDLGAGEVAA